MDRSGIVPLAVALLCIAALGVASTTLESTLTTDPDEEIDPDWERLPIGQDQAQSIKEEMGDGEEAGGRASEQRESSESSESAEEGESQEDAGGGGTGDESEESRSAGEEGESTGAAARNSGSGVGEGSGHGGIPTLLGLLLSFLLWLLKVLVVIALVVGVAVLAYRHRDRFLAAMDRSPPEQEVVAGQIADESWPRADPTSAVDRAWVELVQLVDPEHPSTMTPGEFAATARESGLDSRAVDAITAAFERTHYGGVHPEEEESRARDALNRLHEQLDQVGRDRPSVRTRSDGGEP